MNNTPGGQWRREHLNRLDAERERRFPDGSDGSKDGTRKALGHLLFAWMIVTARHHVPSGPYERVAHTDPAFDAPGGQERI